MDEIEKIMENLENEEVIVELEETEVTAENDAETLVEDEVSDTGELNEEVFESAETAGENAEETFQAPAKKPFVLERTIIKSVCIFLATLFVFGCFVLVDNILNPSVKGVWMLKKVYVQNNEDEAQKLSSSKKKAVYYQFDSNGDFIYRTGTVTQTMKWSYTDENGEAVSQKTNQLILYSEDNPMYSTAFKWSVDGNAFSGKTLYFVTDSEYAMVYEFESCGSQLPEYTMKKNKDFKPVKNLVATWNDKTNGQILTLSEDGTYVLEVSGSLVQKGNYTVSEKDKSISLSYVNNGAESSTDNLPYTIDGKKLTIADYNFTKTK